MIATRGGPGDANATDPVDSESSAVEAVAIFYPPTKLRTWRTLPNLHDGGPPKTFVKSFGPTVTNLAAWKIIGHEMSPIYYINSNLPPTLIYHGDADTLVTLDQPQRFQAEALKQGRTVVLVIHHGGKHGWLTMPLDFLQFGNWLTVTCASRQGEKHRSWLTRSINTSPKRNPRGQRANDQIRGGPCSTINMAKKLDVPQSGKVGTTVNVKTR